MFSIRTLWIAAALALFGPIVGFALSQSIPNDGDPQDTVVHTQGDVQAYVTNVTALRPPDSRPYDPNSLVKTERLVEGHTVFTTIEITRQGNLSRGTVNLTGDIHCWYDVGSDTWVIPVLGIFNVAIPTRLDHASAECTWDDKVIIHPQVGVPLYDAMLVPTGRTWVTESPLGDPAVITEYSFQAPVNETDGTQVLKTFYAWSAPVLPAWVSPDGHEMRWIAQIPDDTRMAAGENELHCEPWSALPHLGS